MDESIRKISSNRISEIKKCLNKNYEASDKLATIIINVSLLFDSKLGVFIVETLESSLTQFGEIMQSHVLKPEQLSSEISVIIPLLDTMKTVSDNDNKQDICMVLITIRFFVTKQQYDFPTKYIKQIR